MHLPAWIESHLPVSREKAGEFVRFCIVGTIAAGIHYGVYCLLMQVLNVNLAYTGGYLFSLVCNFFMTSYITFRSKPSAVKAAGFGMSHLVNYLLHIGLFNLFLWMGVSKLLAPVLVLMVAVPTNFVLLRWVFRHRRKSSY